MIIAYVQHKLTVLHVPVNNFVPRLREDPYLLTGDAYGVDFSTMDEIALSMGFDGIFYLYLDITAACTLCSVIYFHDVEVFAAIKKHSGQSRAFL